VPGVESVVTGASYIQADAPPNSPQFVVPGHQYSVEKTQCGSQLLHGHICKGRSMTERKSRAQTYLLKGNNKDF